MLQNVHSFHIPVMGLAFTIDSPVKVAKYGISSVVSIGDDVLIEDMRKYYCSQYTLPFESIAKFDDDSRARRITAYLDMLDEIVQIEFENVKYSPLEVGSELTKYIELLPDNSNIKNLYRKYISSGSIEDKSFLEETIRQSIKPGNIDVNIMAKVDRPSYAKDGSLLAPEYSAASASLRGYAKSKLHSSLILSAGFNPRLYNSLIGYPDFFPNINGEIVKKVVLKVSDFRSARIQGQYLAKKGIFVSEFRIESGLNCGGHAFPTEGYLMGPILEEFKSQKEQLRSELLTSCSKVWQEKGLLFDDLNINLDISVQGGIGTSNENKFLLDYYKVSSTGWGTPFLLVPEATNVDAETLENLSKAKADQLVLSESSPLGVPFNNFTLSASELQRKSRIEQGRPGSPCLKKYLVSNIEFSKEPICTASRQYIYHKIKELDEKNIPKHEYETAYDSITAKECLCENLAAPAYTNANLKAKLKPSTAICPGPNLAFFSGKFTLKQMVDHIYGRTNLLNDVYRPNMFVNELKLYIDYLRNEVKKHLNICSSKQAGYFSGFISNLNEGIKYYKELIPQIKLETSEYLKKMQNDITKLEFALSEIKLPELANQK